MVLKAAIELLKSIWSVLVEFGVSGTIISGTSAFFLAGWASVKQQEPWFLFWVFLTSFAAVLSVYVILRVYIRTWLDLPHYEQWDLVDPLPLWQAACLWAGKNPTTPINKGKEYAYLHTLKSAIDTGRIPAEKRDGEDAMWLRIKRDDLRKFIEATPERPVFIFKELRKGSF